MPLSGLTDPKYVAIVQGTGVTALTISASKFDLDQCAPLPEAGPGSIDVRQGRCFPDGAIHAFAHIQPLGGSRLESKIQQLGVSSSFKILHDRIVTPGDGLIIFQGMQDANTCFKCSAVGVPPYGPTSALAKRLGVFRPGWNGRTSRSWLV